MKVVTRTVAGKFAEAQDTEQRQADRQTARGEQRDEADGQQHRQRVHRRLRGQQFAEQEARIREHVLRDLAHRVAKLGEVADVMQFRSAAKPRDHDEDRQQQVDDSEYGETQTEDHPPACCAFALSL